MLDGIEPRGRAGIERVLLIRARACGDALEGVPQHRIARAPPVDRVIAFEHRPARPERLDAGLDIGPPHIGQRLRSEEHTSELQSQMRNSYAVFCLKKKNKKETY